MAIFTDNKQRKWEVDIDASSIGRIREDCDENFLLNDGEKQNTYQRLLDDPVLLCRVIALLCAKQCKERDLSEEDFYFGIIGDAIDRATEAMRQAIVDFTPRRTRLLFEMFADQEQLRQETIEKAVAKVNDPQIKSQLRDQIAAKLDGDFQNLLTRLSGVSPSQDSSESAPTD